MSPYETIRTATSNAAEAIDKSTIFGTIEIGKRADLLLLGSNPFETVANLSAIEGVSVRGVWLSPELIDLFMGRLEIIFAHEEDRSLEQRVTLSEIDGLLSDIYELADGGFIFKDHYLTEIANYLDKIEKSEEARRIRSQRTRAPLLMAMWDAFISNKSDSAISYYHGFKSDLANAHINALRELNELGYKLLSAGHNKEAIIVFQLNIDNNPTSANLYDSMAEGLLKVGDTSQAIQIYLMVQELDPNGRVGANASDMLKKLRNND